MSANHHCPLLPDTPRVIAPSPAASEQSAKDGYFPPTARAKSQRMSAAEAIAEHEDGRGVHEETDPDLMRARSTSRSPHMERRATLTSATAGTKKRAEKMVATGTANGCGKEKGFLSPASAYPSDSGSACWRSVSRSPSPLGLIPIHREWRAFVHKHEIPRKALHVSIGFITLWLYYKGAQTSQIHPVLLGLLVPIFSVEVVRFQCPQFNTFYIRVLGAFMRESEAHDRFNGVISYLAGLWAAMYFCRKDVAVMAVLLLSWCDTAASTFGRMWGKYTPRIRRGKSLAGSIAAFTCAVGAAVLFWGLIAPTAPQEYNTGVNSFAYQGTLTLPSHARRLLGWGPAQATIRGPAALGVLSLVSGVVASVGEAIDLWNLDDNLTIPILCGAALGAFLWAFGGS